MDEQDDLFAETEWTRTRRTDPLTSFEAARGILHRLPQLHAKVFEFLLRHHPVPQTSLDMEEHFGDHGSTYRTRLSELEERGLVRKVGYKIQRRHTRVTWGINVKP